MIPIDYKDYQNPLERYQGTQRAKRLLAIGMIGIVVGVAIALLGAPFLFRLARFPTP